MNKRFKTVSLMLFAMGLPMMTAFAANSTIESVEIVQQNGAATGKVVDVNGEPLTGASVVVKGTTKGTMVGNDGKFTINGVKSGDVLRITFVGYAPQEVKWTGSALNVVLEENNNVFDEAVVVGYATQKRANLTGAVASIKGDDLESRPVVDVTAALQGVSPGLNITTNYGGGELGNSMSMNIRGAGSIGSGSTAAPLVLIDGIEGDLATVNPNDIESISVLKDAASASIYGARGSFGVVLVTTKSGKAGRAKVSYTGNVRFTSATQIPEMANSVDFAEYWNAASINSGAGAQFSEEQMARIYGYYNWQQTGSKSFEYNGKSYTFDQLNMNESGVSDISGNNEWDKYGNAYGNTNWFDEFYRSNVPSQEHNLSINGGSEKVTYALSGNFLGTQGLLNHGKDQMQRYTINGKVGAELASWAHMDYNIKFIRNDYNRPSYLTTNGGGLFYHNIARRWPVCPATDINGYNLSGMEIEELETGGTQSTQKDYMTHQLQFVFTPIENWHITANGSYQVYTNNVHTEYLPVKAYRADGTSYYAANGNYGAGQSAVSESRYKQDYFTANIFSDYSWTIAEDHNFKVMAGFNAELWKYNSISGSGQGLNSINVPYLNQTTTNQKVGADLGETAVAGFFGRLNYDYKERYLFEANVRYDGSSRFVGDKQWGLFPSFSAGWNIAKESWFADNRDINTLKLRASWGQLGNNNTTSWYPFYQTMTTGAANSNWLINGAQQNTATMAAIVSSVMTWETVQTLDFGIDWGFFNNRLTGSFDWYQRKTLDMVGPAPTLSSILGADAPKVNNCDLKTNGWELEIQWRDRLACGLSYGIKAVLSDYLTEITNYPNDTKSLGQSYYTGMKLGEIWGYETEGIAQSQEQMDAWLANNKPSWGSGWTAGDVMYRDLNGDGVVNSGNNTADDSGDRRIIGNSTPRYSYGINIDLAWKGIDFSMFWQGVAKRDWAFGAGDPYFWGAQGNLWQSACFVDHLDYWSESNPDAYYPRPYSKNGIQKNQQVQTRYLQNAAYCRLKNIQVGYTFPEQWMSKAGISKLRVYFSADNLLTITSMAKQFDPENLSGYWGSGKTYPLTRTFSFGLNLNF